MEQFVNLIVQACQSEFYFSHRIFFQLRSVTFDSIKDAEQIDQQKKAVNDVLTSIYEMLTEQIETQADDQYVERMFLQNSKDLVKLLVNFNMVHFHPQLKFDSFTANLDA